MGFHKGTLRVDVKLKNHSSVFKIIYENVDDFKYLRSDRMKSILEGIFSHGPFRYMDLEENIVVYIGSRNIGLSNGNHAAGVMIRININELLTLNGDLMKNAERVFIHELTHVIFSSTYSKADPILDFLLDKVSIEDLKKHAEIFWLKEYLDRFLFPLHSKNLMKKSVTVEGEKIFDILNVLRKPFEEVFADLLPALLEGRPSVVADFLDDPSRTFDGQPGLRALIDEVDRYNITEDVRKYIGNYFFNKKLSKKEQLQLFDIYLGRIVSKILQDLSYFRDSKKFNMYTMTKFLYNSPLGRSYVEQVLKEALDKSYQDFMLSIR